MINKSPTYRHNVNIVTSKGWHLPMQFIFAEVKEEDIVTNKDLTTKLCKGCKMYGSRGGCPPFSPSYDRVFRGKYKHHYLIIANIPVIHWMGNKVKAMENIARKMMLTSSFIEVMFKYLEKFIVEVLKSYGGRTFPSSWCNLCKKCAVAKQLPCVNPTQRGFSMEATGILVEPTLINAGLGRLEWFEWKSRTIPGWIKKIVLYSSDTELNYKEFMTELLKSEKIQSMNPVSTRVI